MARFAIQHEPTKKWLREDEAGAFLEKDDSFLMTYKTEKIAQKAINDHYKVYYTTISDDRFVTEDGTFPFEEFMIVQV